MLPSATAGLPDVARIFRPESAPAYLTIFVRYAPFGLRLQQLTLLSLGSTTLTGARARLEQGAKRPVETFSTTC